MSARINLKIGRRFGSLRVLRFHGRGNGGSAYWICLCDCGKETIAKGFHLQTGHTKSCGCKQGGRTDLVGKRFDRLVVLNFAKTDSYRTACWRCVCYCGKETVVRGTSLTSQKTKSCGCFGAEQRLVARIKHGCCRANFKTPEYYSWLAMIQRCTYPSQKKYKFYGGAGVTVCPRWRGKHGFENFLNDLGERPVGTTLGRFGDVGNYERGNCKWMTRQEQLLEARIKRATAKTPN